MPLARLREQGLTIWRLDPGSTAYSADHEHHSGRSAAEGMASPLTAASGAYTLA